MRIGSTQSVERHLSVDYIGRQLADFPDDAASLKVLVDAPRQQTRPADDMNSHLAVLKQAVLPAIVNAAHDMEVHIFAIRQGLSKHL